MSGISLNEVLTPHEAEEARIIRNEVAHFMTGNPDQITEEQQQIWFERQYSVLRGAGRMVLFLVAREGQNVGYATVREDADRQWVTAGLVASARGQGTGREVFEMLTRQIHEDGHDEAWLQVRADNEPARNLYESLGYTAVEGESADNVITMVHRSEDAAD